MTRMNKIVIANYDVYADDTPAIEINGIDINTVYHYSIQKYRGDADKYIKSKKEILTLSQCSSECIKNNNCHLCKLTDYITNDGILNCPYIYKTTSIKEPKLNSQSYVLWHYIKKFLIYRNKFGKYASYLSLNDEFTVDDKLYNILKAIPEFSLKYAFEASYDLEEYKAKIFEDKKFKYYIPSKFHKPFFNSLLELYKDEIERYRSFINCQILMDKETVKYLQWREYQNNPLIEIGDYYFIANDNIYTLSNLPSFLHYNKDARVKFLSFLKIDINLAYDYFKEHKLFYDFSNRFLLETMESIINRNE